jgi:pimeloyl-ACP methyl ester carboxylesterase
MHVERYGHGGAPVLLVHGFGTCAFLWRNIGPEIALANRTAFAVDLFGYGESDRPFDASLRRASTSTGH